MKIRGFTLLEIIIVIVILGILAALGFLWYSRTIEKSRAGETKIVLGSIRTSEVAYFQQFGGYTSDIRSLPIDTNNITACVANGNYYFSYSIDPSGNSAIATRCTAGLGKNPSAGVAYTVTLDFGSGIFGGSDAGYY